MFVIFLNGYSKKDASKNYEKYYIFKKISKPAKSADGFFFFFLIVAHLLASWSKNTWMSWKTESLNFFMEEKNC